MLQAKCSSINRFKANIQAFRRAHKREGASVLFLMRTSTVSTTTYWAQRRVNTIFNLSLHPSKQNTWTSFIFREGRGERERRFGTNTVQLIVITGLCFYEIMKILHYCHCIITVSDLNMYTEHGRRDPSRRSHGTLYPQRLALTSPTSGGRSVGVVLSRTQAKEFSFFSLYKPVNLCE
jgi:hypothetical protein